MEMNSRAFLRRSGWFMGERVVGRMTMCVEVLFGSRESWVWGLANLKNIIIILKKIINDV